MELQPKPSSTSITEAHAEEELAGGRYLVWRKLGSGAQAETLEAVDRKDGRPVAVKRFHVGHARSWKDVELAEREARVLASLHHPALPAYVDHFEEQGALYLVMELVAGESLAMISKSGKRLGQSELRDLLATLSDVLEYLHTRVPPVIHRDIKPGNIILRPNGGYCLVDFGSVRDGLRPDGGSTVVGTFGYMAPEQFQGRAMPATDVYAVGALLVSLVTGKSPEELPHRGLSIDVGAAIGNAVSPAWVHMISRMVEIDPDQRSSSLKPLLESLDHGVDSTQPAGQGSAVSNAPVDLSEHDPDASFTVMVGSGFGILPFLVLNFARIVVWVALGVLLPTILNVLAVFLGPRLRRTAFHVSQAGYRASAQLAKASRHLQRAEPFVLRGRHYRRKWR